MSGWLSLQQALKLSRTDSLCCFLLPWPSWDICINSVHGADSFYIHFKHLQRFICTVRLLYPLASHPWIQPTISSKRSGHRIVSILDMLRLCFMPLFPKKLFAQHCIGLGVSKLDMIQARRRIGKSST